MPRLEAIAKHYDRLASSYEARWAAYNEIQRDWVMAHLPGVAPDSVLELGCGQGKMLQRLQALYPEVQLTGVDASAGMLQNSMAQAGILHGNVEDATVISQLPSADIVLSLSVLHHLNDPIQHLRVLRSHVKAGGAVFISAFAHDSLPMKLAGVWFRRVRHLHKTTWSHQQMRKQVEMVFVGAKITCEILRPDLFWHVQIFRIQV